VAEVSSSPFLSQFAESGSQGFVQDLSNGTCHETGHISRRLSEKTGYTEENGGSFFWGDTTNTGVRYA
jgi:hypothetical protein